MHAADTGICYVARAQRMCMPNVTNEWTQPNAIYLWMLRIETFNFKPIKHQLICCISHLLFFRLWGGWYGLQPFRYAGNRLPAWVERINCAKLKPDRQTLFWILRRAEETVSVTILIIETIKKCIYSFHGLTSMGLSLAETNIFFGVVMFQNVNDLMHTKLGWIRNGSHFHTIGRNLLIVNACIVKLFSQILHKITEKINNQPHH